MNLTVDENTLDAEQFLTLRRSVGWKGNKEQIEKSLKLGLYNVTVKYGGEAVGMGRLVGDGVMYWYIQDVVVLPAYQGRGVGKKIMECLLNHIEKSSADATTVTIYLMAAKGKEAFYNKFGFITRPTEEYGAGMIKMQPISRG